PALAAMHTDPFERRHAPARAAARATVPSGGGPAADSSEPRASRIRIVSTNDFHGALLPRPDSRGVTRGGAAYIATAIESARAGCDTGCAFLLLDGGDMFQGTPASNFAWGRPVVDLFNALGYAAAALGNHEFDWGVDTLRARMADARFSILGANVRYADGRDVEWIPDDTLVERAGLRIGIIGIASVHTAGNTRAENVRGLRFDEPAPIVNARARALRARGADAIIVVAHEGAFCGQGGSSCGGEIIDLARELTEKVDAIVSGHTHSHVETVVNGIPIVQARSSGTAIGVIDLPRGKAPSVDVVDVLPDSLAPSPGVDSLVQRAHAAVAAVVDARVAAIAQPMPRRGSQYALGNLIADAQRAAGDADVAVMNNGGIRTGLRAGVATYGALYEIQPFANMLRRLSVRGSDLRAYFERELGGSEPDVHVSGVTITYEPSRSSGERIESISIPRGTALDSAKVYTVVLNDFMVGRGAGLALARGALANEVLDVQDIDALVAYLRAAPQPVRAPTGSRIVARR
ncbi:MAG: 5'-nucleotidase C-terminal domain-containing protein, partial [Gemmatimonadota bacterium]|nr:5'-nucleotidase C-terminal domain-containing protein [Gemmatimonadota bacterium]